MGKEHESPSEKIKEDEDEGVEKIDGDEAEHRYIPLSIGPDGNVIPKHLADTEKRFNQEHGL